MRPERSHRTSLVAAGGALALALACGFVAPAAAQRVPTTRLHVVEDPVSDRVVDVGARGDSVGDLLPFHNPLFDAAGTRRVGFDQGHCVRVDPRQGRWQCEWTSVLRGGDIHVAGIFLDAGTGRFVVDGGTGRYLGVRGEMRLRTRPDRRYDFLYRLVPMASGGGARSR